jgi:hypothetical protein
MNGKIRRAFFIVMLLGLAAAFFYEYLVARPQRDRVQNELADLANDTTQRYTHEQIDRMIGRPGTIVSESKYQKTVKYSWRGLAWRSYDLFVQYRKMGESTLLSSISTVPEVPFSPLIERWEAEDARQRTAEAAEAPLNAEGGSGGRGLVTGG